MAKLHELQCKQSNNQRRYRSMEIEMKLSDVLNLNQTLKTIIDDTNTKADALLKFKLLGIMKALENHVTNFDIIRNEKIREYGKENEDGNISISSDDKEAIKNLNNDLSSIINSDVSLNITKLKSGDVFNKGIKADYLMNLYPIIEE